MYNVFHVDETLGGQKPTLCSSIEKACPETLPCIPFVDSVS